MFRDGMKKDNKSQILDGRTIREMLEGKLLLTDVQRDVLDVWYMGQQGEVLRYRSCTMTRPDYKLGVFTGASVDPY